MDESDHAYTWDLPYLKSQRLKEVRSLTSNDCLGIIMPDGNYVPGTICRVHQVQDEQIVLEFTDNDRGGECSVRYTLPADWVYDTYEKVFNALPEVKR